MSTTPEPVDILLVEDTPHERELSRRALAKAGSGVTVVDAKDGEEALDFVFARGRFDDRKGSPAPRVVLLDLKLPKVGGLEVLRQIKADEKTRAIPVVVLSSSQDAAEIAECYAAGVNSFVVKPTDFDDFIDTVSKAGEYWLSCNRLPDA